MASTYVGSSYIAGVLWHGQTMSLLSAIALLLLRGPMGIGNVEYLMTKLGRSACSKHS